MRKKCKRLLIALIGAAVLFTGCGGNHDDRERSDRDKKESSAYETSDVRGDYYSNDVSFAMGSSEAASYEYYSDDIYYADDAACAIAAALSAEKLAFLTDIEGVRIIGHRRIKARHRLIVDEHAA